MSESWKEKPASLLDVMRGREGDLTPATLRIMDAAIKDGEATEHPADAWLKAGVDSPDHLRKVLMAKALFDGMRDTFASVLGEQAVDYAAGTLAAIDAAASMCGSLYDINQFDDDGFADMLVAEFRGTLLRTIAYWREKRGN